MTIDKAIRADIVSGNARGTGDTGSPEVQVALLTARINDLTPHFKTHLRTTTVAVACCAWCRVAASCSTT